MSLSTTGTVVAVFQNYCHVECAFTHTTLKPRDPHGFYFHELSLVSRAPTAVEAIEAEIATLGKPLSNDEAYYLLGLRFALRAIKEEAK